MANKAYEAGDYKAAIHEYEQLAELYQSSDLYKNLGNAHFRLNNLGKAILYYEKAVKINPSDQDARFNLSFAKNKTLDRLGDEGDDKIGSFFRQIITSTPANNWALLSIVFFILFFATLVLLILNKKIKIKRLYFVLSLALAFFSIVIIIFAFQAKQYATSYSHAIIIDEKVDVKSEPIENGTDLFVLHEGAKIEIVQEKAEWVEIMLPNGTKGWVEQDDLGRI